MSQESLPAPAESNGGYGSAFQALFELKTLKAAASLLGVLGSSGGSLIAASYGIGYLAISKHNEMVGIPTTGLDHEAYIRTGALFFSNSLFHLFSTPTAYVLVVAVFGILFERAIAKRAEPVGADPSGKRAASETKTRLLRILIAQVLLFVFALLIVYVQSTAFNPVNKNVIHEMLRKRDEIQSLVAANEQPPEQSSQVDQILFHRQPFKISERVNTALQHERGRERLTEFFGQQLALILLFVLSFVAVRLARRSLVAAVGRTAEGRVPVAETRLATAERLLHFFLYALALAILVNLPAAYGILVLPTEAMEVKIIEMAAAEQAGRHGIGTLLTDPSSDPAEIWILGRAEDDDSRSQLKVFDRTKIDRIELRGVIKNFLAVQSPGTEAAQEPGGSS